MPTTAQKVLFCFLLLNVTIVVLNIAEGQNLWDRNKIPLLSLTLRDNTTEPSNFLENNHKELIDDSFSKNSSHPFNKLSKRLESLDWNPHRIDEVIRKFWKTEKTFLEYFVDEKTKINKTVLSTSCLHTAAWIVVGLLEQQIRPNHYLGLFKLPKNKNLIVYNNTQKPPSANATFVTDSLRKFIDSRPLDEPILLQVDMYQLKNTTYPKTYIDHHFAIHIYNGQISLYQGWQDFFSLIDWMREPHSFNYLRREYVNTVTVW